VKGFWPLAIVIPLILAILLVAGCAQQKSTVSASGTASSTATITTSMTIPSSGGSVPSSASTSSGTASSGTIIVSSSVPDTATTASSKATGSYYFPLLEESVKSAIPEIASPYVDAVMKTDQETYSTSAAKIQFTIESRSEHEVMTGEPYSLEIFRDSTWYTVPFKKLAGNVVRAWPADGHPIPAQGSLPGSISLSEHLPLIAGRYRLVKEIMTQDRKDYWGNSYIWAEFRVISD
jgi:hypothetical protein